MCPQLFAYRRQSVGEGGITLVLPSRPPKSPGRLCHPAMREQSDHREQSQQCRCGPPYRHIRPLTLRAESQVPPHLLLEGYFQLPTHHEPREDLLRIGVQIGTQEGLGLELLPWVWINTQRTGTANKPVEYHTAVSEAISTVRSLSPYQLASVVGFQTVLGSSATSERLGKRSPFMRGLPIWPGLRGGAGS